MNIGIVTTWFERGAGYVSKQYKKILSSNNNIYIFARGGERKAIGNVDWDSDNVHWAEKNYSTSIDLEEFKSWIDFNNIECVLFNEQQNWQVILFCNKNRIKCGAYIDYYTEETIPFFSHYDFIICNTKRHYSVFNRYAQSFYVPWGTDVNLFIPKTYELVNRDKVTFFHSAGFNPKRKGTVEVIKAFDKLCSKYPENVKLVIHTQVEIQSQDKSIAEILNKNQNIEIIKRTVTAPGLYYLGDVYVYPTELEGIGLTIAEAISSGLPVIVTGCGPMTEFGNEEIRRDIEVEYYYTRKDAYYWPLAKISENSLYIQMCYFVENKKQLPLIKKKAREYALKNLDWINNTDNLDYIFKNTIIKEHLLDDESKIYEYDRKNLPLEGYMKAYFYQIKKIKEKIDKYKNEDKEVYLYPAGKMTERLIDMMSLTDDIKIDGILDKREKYIGGIKTKTPYVVAGKDKAVILITSSLFEEELKKELICEIKYKGLIDTCFFNNPDINNIDTIKEQDLLIERMDLVLTSKCSLRCEKCANLMQYYHNPQNVSFDIIIQSMGKLISVVDRINTVYVLGGEPFLYPDLSKVIHFLKRFNKVGEIVIVTNGTMLPIDNSKELWKELSDSKVSVRISDYGQLSKMKNEILNLCQRNYVNVEILENKYFYDTGKMNKRNRSKEALEKVFRDCATQCRSLYNGELHFCPRSAHGTDLGIVGKREEDYVNLLVEENDNVIREKIKKLHNKYDYIQACDYCDIRVNDYYEKKYPVAEQAKNVLSVN